jgi:MFS superfamily sulfate permease-like transporter
MSHAAAAASPEAAPVRGGLVRDFTASIVVFLVAMPLCMGIAIASGVPPEKGLVTGIIGGIVVGLLAGSPLQVSARPLALP